jgi:MFS family permease
MWAATTDPNTIWIIVAVFFVSGFTYPLYSLALSHINDVAPEGSAVAVSSLVVFVTSTGAVIGPIVAAKTMDSFGPAGLFWMLFRVHASVAVFSMIRITIREGLPVSAQRAFANVPAWAGVIGTDRRHRNGKTTDRDS